LLSVAAVLCSLLVAAPASAHGYVSAPPSRQALCANGTVTGCGDIQWEPQSVEGPKGLRSCSGGNSRFAVLDNDARGWPATSVGTSTTFTWVFTARHATRDYEYYIGNTRLALFSGNGQQPPQTVSHQVNLAGFSGRQKVLAIWNIADTPMAFYACIDVQIGGGGGGNPTPTPTRTANPTPTRTVAPTTAPPPTASGTWRANTAYAVGSVVTYNGISYRCRQAHTSLPGWEPPFTPALWLAI
jgi:chitin-binding protein